MRRLWPLTLISIVGIWTCLAVAAGGDKEAVKAVVGEDGVQRAGIVGGDFFFDPGHIVVRVNTPVELTLRKNPGLTPHKFVMKSPGAGMEINEVLSSEPKVIRFTPTKTGTYPFYCDSKLLFFKSHRDQGMEGAIEVVE